MINMSTNIPHDFIVEILEGLNYDFLVSAVEKYNLKPASNIECKVQDEQTVICWQWLQNCPPRLGLENEFSFVARKLNATSGKYFRIRVYFGIDERTNKCYVLAKGRYEPWGL